MREIKKKIISLSIILSLITFASGCKKNEIHLESNPNTKKEELCGNLYKEDLKYCFIVESIDDNGYTYLSLVYDKYGNEELYKKYGETTNIMPFEPFIEEYKLNKDVYTSKDIEDILNKIKINYNNQKTLKLSY